MIVKLRFVPGSPAGGVAATLLATSVLVGVLVPFRSGIGLLNVGFLFLLLTLLIASIWGRAVGIFAALLVNVAFNFFFLEPLHNFTVQEPRNVVALAIFLAVSAIGGGLLATAVASAQEAKRRQAEAEVALALSRALGLETQPEAALKTLCSFVTSALATPGAAVLVRGDLGWEPVASAGDGSPRPPDTAERALADRAAAEGRTLSMGGAIPEMSRRRRIVIPHGREVAYESGPAVVFVPLRLGAEIRGILRLDGPLGESPFGGNPWRLLDAVASEAAITLQRIDLAKDAARTEALAQADQMKAALLSSISHDLNTPLAGIKAAVSSLLDPLVSWSPSDVDAMHRSIGWQTDRLMRLIAGIIELNRVQAGELTPDPASLFVRDLLNRAAQTTSPEAKDRNITIAASDSCRVIADDLLITQALVNLIENALRYSPPDSAIRLTAIEAGEIVEIQVRDEGPGIPETDLPHIFERHFRSADVRAPGSGLGLTIVKSFVELCGGSVTVESSASGTVFRLRLPADTENHVPV